MIIYPAIDLRRGRCVRLRSGEYNTENAGDEDPVSLASRWANEGAEWLHLVNWDGPVGATKSHLATLHRSPNILVQRPGYSEPATPEADLLHRLPLNLCRLREIRRAVSTPIQFDGGLQTLDDIRLALELGADRVVLSATLLAQPALVNEALELWGPERLVARIDIRAGQVVTSGQPANGTGDVLEFGYRLKAMGIERVIYTELSENGSSPHCPVEAAARLGDMTDLRVIVKSGNAKLEEIERLQAHKHYNIEGAILDQALNNGQLALPEAIAIGRRPLVRRSAGIVPYRRTENGIEFLLLFNLFFEQWQFPRGGVHKGESDPSCALREFTEETGLPIVKLHEGFRSELHYTARIRHYDIERFVVYFLAETANQEIHLGHENHSEARWLSPAETWALLTETSPEQLPAFDAAMAYLQLTI